MTKVEVFYNRNVIIGFRMEGHAMLNAHGFDILCASLSTASQMTVNGIIDWIGLDADEIVQELDKARAIIHVIIPPEESESSVVQQLFRSFIMYIEELAKQYPDNVKLERRKRKR